MRCSPIIGWSSVDTGSTERCSNKYVIHNNADILEMLLVDEDNDENDNDNDAGSEEVTVMLIYNHLT